MATTKQGSKGKELLEDPELIIDQSGEFFEKNGKLVLYIGGAIILAVMGYFGYRYFQNENNQTAEAAGFKAVMAWEKDSLKAALNGDKTIGDGLNTISEEYSGTKAGNLADYRVGVALLKEGKFEDAIDKLKSFSSNDLILQGQVYSLIGDAYMEMKDYENAEEYYAKSSNYKPNEFFTPNYLMKLALSFELQKKYDEAADAYERIIVQYPKSKVVSDAKKFKARAEGLASSATSKEDK